MASITFSDINVFAGFSGTVDQFRGIDDDGNRAAPLWPQHADALDRLAGVLDACDLDSDYHTAPFCSDDSALRAAALAVLALCEADHASAAAAGAVPVDSVPAGSVTITD